MALLTPESLQKIEREAAKYPPEQRQSAVMSALGIAQDEHGVLSNEVMEEVANVLRMPKPIVEHLCSPAHLST